MRPRAIMDEYVAGVSTYSPETKEWTMKKVPHVDLVPKVFGGQKH